MNNNKCVLGYRLHEGEKIQLNLKPKKSTAAYFLISKLARFIPLIIVICFFHFMDSQSSGKGMNLVHHLQHTVMQQTVNTDLIIGGVIILLLALTFFWMKQVVKSYEYQKLISYPPRKSNRLGRLLLKLIHQIGRILFFELPGIRVASSMVNNLVQEGYRLDDRVSEGALTGGSVIIIL